MISKCIFWLKGYCLVRISSRNGERFINLCKNQRMAIKDIHKHKDYITFIIPAKSFVKLIPIASKVRSVPHIVSKKGFPFKIKRYCRRKTFFIGIALFMITLYILSLFLWDIEIKGDHRITKDTLMKYLIEQNIHTGVVLTDIDCQALETNIRNKFDDIAWVSAEIRGTRLILNVSETEKSTLDQAKSIEDSHIIASSDGVVKEIITGSGTQLVNKGDKVKKGQILIEGTIGYKDDSKTVVSKRPVAAQGTVILTCKRNYQDKFSLLHTEKVYTGRQRSKMGFAFGEKRILVSNLIKQFETYEKCDIIKNDCPITIGKNFVLPIHFLHHTEWEYKMEERTYSLGQAKDLASKHYQTYMISLTNKGIKIVSEKNTYQIIDNTAVVNAELTTEEVQTERKKVNEAEWSVESPDADGDTNGNSDGT